MLLAGGLDQWHRASGASHQRSYLDRIDILYNHAVTTNDTLQIAALQDHVWVPCTAQWGALKPNIKARHNIGQFLSRRAPIIVQFYLAWTTKESKLFVRIEKQTPQEYNRSQSIPTASCTTSAVPQEIHDRASMPR